METHRQILPAPDQLTSRDQLETWMVSIRAKFAVDGGAIGTAMAQFYYVYSRLGPGMQSTFLPYVTRQSQTPSPRDQPEAFLAYINQTLGDPHKERRAGLNLVKMRQRPGEAIGPYVTRWEHTLFKAGSHNWNDHAKVILLASGLLSEAKERLDKELSWPATYEGFVTLLRRFDGVFGIQGRPITDSAPLREQPEDVMQIDAITPSHQRKRRRCFQCNEVGHFKRDCLKARASPAIGSLLTSGEEEFDWGEE